MSREPELNSLDRYVKSSPRFVLEEYGHCEVPAGCGGAVLRWRNRFTSIPVELNMAVVGAQDWEVRFDGAQVRTTSALLPPGRHVCMITVAGVVEAEFAFLVWLQSPDFPAAPLGWTPGPPGMWRVSGHEPTPEAWTDPDVDVASWPGCEPTQIADDSQTPYSVHRLQNLGAQPLTAPRGVADDVGPRLWLRAVFDVPAPE